MLLEDEVGPSPIIDAQNAAASAGLTYVTGEEPGMTRHRAGKGFFFRRQDGARIADRRVLDRIRSLGIPPAWTDVWICPDADGHIQATGRDAKGRKQYRYHPRFRDIRDSTKYEHMTAFAKTLPAIRATVSSDMARRGLPREKVLATVVHLLETTLIRIGNIDYVKQNKSYGLTTLRRRHVVVAGTELRFQFLGKSGKTWQLTIRNPRVAKIVKACQDLPGQQLFQYLDEAGHRDSITSTDVNAYLRAVSGQDITAKDFRTWAGTVLAALALHEIGAIDTEAKAKKNVRAAIEHVATRLGNTPAICRKCYVHPEIVNSYLAGDLLLDVKQKVEAELRDALSNLRPEEAAVLALLQKRLGDEIEQAPKRAV